MRAGLLARMRRREGVSWAGACCVAVFGDSLPGLETCMTGCGSRLGRRGVVGAGTLVVGSRRW